MRFTVLACALTLTTSALAETRTLSEIYDLALANDPALRIEQAIRNSAEASKDAAEASRWLTASATLSQAYTDDSRADETFDTASGSITLSMPVFDRPIAKAIEGARAGALAADAGLLAFRQTHIVTVSRAYFDVLSAERDLQAAVAEVEAVTKQLEQATERLAVGIGTRVDVDQARAQLDLSKVGVISAEVAVQAARADLGRMIGQEPEALAALSEAYPAALQPNLRLDIEQAVARHPLVIEQSETYRSALAEVAEARGERWPSLSLSSTYTVTDKNGASTGNGLTAQGNVVSLSLAVPLFKSGGYDAAIARAEASLMRQEATLDQVRREVSRNIRIAYQELEASARTVEARSLAIVSAASRLEATEAAYSVGSGDIVEVLNAQKDMIAAERDLAKARHTHVIRQLQFDQALGDLSEVAVTRLDAALVQ